MAVEPLRGSSANACKRSTSRNVSTVESSARAKPCCNKLLTTVEMSSAASVNAIVYKHANGAGSTRSHSAPKTMPAMTAERGSSNDAMTAKMTGGRKGMTPKNVIDPRSSRRRKKSAAAASA